MRTLSEVSIEEYAYADFDMDDLVTRAQTQDGQVTQSTIESAWLPVKTLKFNDCRIDWKSKAYHGLTEFRLIYGPVGEAGLISVLQSSPQIRVLELEFELKNYNSEQMQSRPVALNNLEVLVLRLSPEDLSSVLRYITPGSIPLSLSLHHPWDHLYEFPGLTELQSFVARSNIHRFNAIKFKACFELTEFLSMIPTIRVLAVDRFKHTFKKESSTPSDFTLDALYVLHSKYGTVFPWPSLERFVKKHNVQKLTLWKYNFEASGPGEIGYKTIPDNLYTICPVVKVVPDSEPNPIAEWY
ncbi:hypothetical protein FRC11_000417 [Ceratobasidium sp. 423]|nr:hypothetical protein FRC11_000417 [Ceratobasidium sp. 423]